MRLRQRFYLAVRGDGIEERLTQSRAGNVVGVGVQAGVGVAQPVMRPKHPFASG